MMTLVLGASSSGKSALAESLAVQYGAAPRYYLATMHHGSAETERRIARHRAMRQSKGFVTVEQPLDVGSLCLPPDSVCLLECLSNLVANELYDRTPPEQPTEKLLHDLNVLHAGVRALVIVSNDVFSDGAQYDAFCTRYLEVLGELNRAIAHRADVVIESVAGLPFYHKGARK